MAVVLAETFMLSLEKELKAQPVLFCDGFLFEKLPRVTVAQWIVSLF